MNVLTPGFLQKSYKNSINIEENFPSFDKRISYIKMSKPPPSIYASYIAMQPSERKSQIDPNGSVFADNDSQDMMDSPLLENTKYRKSEPHKKPMGHCTPVKNAEDSPDLVKHGQGYFMNSPSERHPAKKRRPKGPMTMMHLAPQTHAQFSHLKDDNPGSGKNIRMEVNVKCQPKSLFLKKLEDAGIITSPDGQLEDEDIPQFTNDLKKRFEIGKQATDIGIYVKVLRKFIETDLPGLSMERKKFYKLKLAEDLRTVNMQYDQEITPNESNISPKKIARRDGRSTRQITAGKNMSLKLVLQKKSKNFLPFRPLELNHFQYNNSLHGALGELTLPGGFNIDFENHKSRSRGTNVSNGIEGNKNYRKFNTSTNGTGSINRMGNQFVSPGKSIQKLTKKPERPKREKKTTSPRYNFGHSSTLRKESIGTSEGSRSIRKSKDRERKSGTVIDVHGIQNAKRASYAKKAISKSYTDLTISGLSAIDSPKERDYGVSLNSHIGNQNIPTFANLSHGELPPIVEQSPMCDDSQETSNK